jgi:HSP20 family protein
VRFYRPRFGFPSLRRDLDPYWDTSAGPQETIPGEGEEEAWQPPVDILETADHIRFEIEVPGVEPEDINVSVTGDLLTLRGSKRHPKDINDVQWHRNERSFGSFARSFKLLSPVDNEKVTADFHNGLLSIVLPKAESSRRREITVNTV